MIFDASTMFDGPAAAITSTAPSANVIDLGVARDVAIGDSPNDLKVLVQVISPLVSVGATTLQVQVQGSTDNSTFTTYAESRAIAKAALIAGAHAFDIDVPRPGPGDSLPRYLRLNYVVATGPFTGGTVTAALVLGRDDAPVYASGLAVQN